MTWDDRKIFLPDQLWSKIKRIIKEREDLAYGSVSDFVLDAIRHRFEDMEKTGKRVREVAMLLVREMEHQVGDLQAMRKEYGELIEAAKKKSSQEMINILDRIELFSNFYREQVFSALIPELTLLPSECLEQIFEFYKYSKAICEQLKRCIEEGNATEIVTIIWANTELVVRTGYRTLSCVYEKVLYDFERVELCKNAAEESEEIRKKVMDSYNKPKEGT